MKLLHISTYILLVFLSSSVVAQTKTASTGNWNNVNTWSPSGVPGDNEVILIPAGVTVTVLGTDHTMNNSTLVVQGTLLMETTCSTCFDYGSLSFTGSSSAVIIEVGGQVQDGTLFGGDTHYISVDGETFWSGDNCSSNCGEIEGDYAPTEETSWPDGADNPLPIELLAFNASLSGDNIIVTWSTASEINNDFFTIERSEDGLNWNEIHIVAGAGHSSMRLDYSFTDIYPIPGLSYYRLKQTDFDGAFEYFDPKVVLYEPDNLFQMFPNPATDVLNIRTSSDLNQATIQIRNMNGKALPVPVDATSHRAELNLNNLTSGVYLLEIVFPQSVLRKSLVIE